MNKKSRIDMKVSADQPISVLVGSDKKRGQMDIAADNPINMSVRGEKKVSPMGVGVKIVAGNAPEYDGAYEVVPCESVQTLKIKNKQATEDIIIDPIPSNYGLITYNGSIITVS